MNDGSTIASFADIHPDRESVLGQALAGLGATPKTLPSKFFYDERGSKLFERICEVPEYYVTRVETALLGDIAGQAAEMIGADACIIEYGTGSSEKIALLLAALDRPAAFVGVDISSVALRGVAETLAGNFPDLAVHAVCADFTQPFTLPAMSGQGRRVVFFPGSSLGNFNPEQSVDFIANAARLIGPGGGMLFGIDLKKDAAILDAAYDDAAGVTAEFNLNLLRRLNRECGADFDLDAFSHRAFYNANAGRVEMHLVSRRAQSITLGAQTITFAEGETIHTENSYKYSVPEFQDLARRAGCEPMRAWTDANSLFSLHYLSVI
ncbi:MAG: L-histidine N(alpha)-methyltransferase [Rhodospirillaceae bacterium]|jgi:dimethylhistidine N-methyltransferase|nr:L-histidine N(alpha)-methyltransferase [Rhodospirillaceae bacterium]MBT4044532.1 L-histidine N(alpha)-methyltransferase [Rhodospirillaceae bacterium]MBT4688207.1 L-histidine N(alpha)-methyltransferase [Rhodospirillaceae bacterium]MBT5079200.1 L-histidine N(alpha)-methyltransferase [Rhodospirillaceae bacterium]MBT5522516.1 L-histidine N(alpha)-methyltransferase [Rhodospirillaceae bacterium]